MEELIAFSPQLAAAKIGISLATMRRLLARREIGYSRVGRRLVLSIADLEAYLNARHVPASAVARATGAAAR
ncbi:MAG: helix-turn-helix domain-containing protein [Terriglobales bacterium]